MNRPASPSTFQNPWLWAGVALAIVVVTVNVIFVLVAQTTNPGLVTEEYVKHGQHQHLLDAQYRAQSQRGWDVSVNLPLELHSGTTTEAHVIARDHSGAALTGGRVEMISFRPSDASQDRGLEFSEDSETPGRYSSALIVPAPGVWDISILFESRGEKFLLNRRVLIDPPPGYVRRTSALERIVSLLIDSP